MKNPKIKYRWKQGLGFPESPYLVRWVLESIKGSIRLHHWNGSDDHRFPHDHSWWFITVILWGSYTDMTPVYDDDGNLSWKEEKLTFGNIRFRDKDHKHYVHVDPGKTCWSLLITGPTLRPFGFWVKKDKRLKANKYFFTHGHHSPFSKREARKTKKMVQKVFRRLFRSKHDNQIIQKNILAFKMDRIKS